eukprot:Clim_evm9s38 gene=Clim_evmTU9s38
MDIEGGTQTTDRKACKEYELACGRGDLESVQKWAKALGTDLTLPCKLRPLQYAALGGHDQVVQYLVEKDMCAIKTIVPYSRTLLHNKAISGDLKEVKLLVEQENADVNARDTKLWTPLHFAAKLGHEEIVRYLVGTAKADIGARTVSQLTPLLFASWGGHEGMVRYLVGQKGADIGAKDKQGETSLHWAAQKCHCPVVKALLEFGADRTVLNRQGRQPKGGSADHDHSSAINKLLKEYWPAIVAPGSVAPGTTATDEPQRARGLPSPARSLKVPATPATSETPSPPPPPRGQATLVRSPRLTRTTPKIPAPQGQATPTLVPKPAGTSTAVEIPPPQRQATPTRVLKPAGTPTAAETPPQRRQPSLVRSRKLTDFELACQRGDLKMVSIGAETLGLNVYFLLGQMPLHLVTANGHEHIVRCLVDKYKAELNAVDRHGWTPLHYAAAYGHWKVVDYLVTNKRANDSARNAEGALPLHLAAAFGHKEVLRYLAGSKPDNARAAQNDGWTPLHMAAHNGDDAMVQFLVGKVGTDTEAKTNDDLCTPLHLAARGGNEDVVKTLLRFGANRAAKDRDGNLPTCREFDHDHAKEVNETLQTYRPNEVIPPGSLYAGDLFMAELIDFLMCREEHGDADASGSTAGRRLKCLEHWLRLARKPTNTLEIRIMYTIVKLGHRGGINVAFEEVVAELLNPITVSKNLKSWTPSILVTMHATLEQASADGYLKPKEYKEWHEAYRSYLVTQGEQFQRMELEVADLGAAVSDMHDRLVKVEQNMNIVVGEILNLKSDLQQVDQRLSIAEENIQVVGENLLKLKGAFLKYRKNQKKLDCVNSLGNALGIFTFGVSSLIASIGSAAAALYRVGDFCKFEALVSVELPERMDMDENAVKCIRKELEAMPANKLHEVILNGAAYTAEESMDREFNRCLQNNEGLIRLWAQARYLELEQDTLPCADPPPSNGVAMHKSVSNQALNEASSSQLGSPRVDDTDPGLRIRNCWTMGLGNCQGKNTGKVDRWVTEISRHPETRLFKTLYEKYDILHDTPASFAQQVEMLWTVPVVHNEHQEQNSTPRESLETDTETMPSTGGQPRAVSPSVALDGTDTADTETPPITLHV